MSDFDKEAEREKLRERFEQDQQEREATQRMSDLLLKGATMTNSHCDRCGSPVFRQNGEEFCPSCQQERGGSGEGDGQDVAAARRTNDEQPNADRTEAASTDSTPDEPSKEAPARGRATASSPETEVSASTPDADGADAGGSDRRSNRHRTTDDGTAVESEDTSESAATDATSMAADAARQPARSSDDAVASARVALSDALVTHARLASDTTDPHRAREHLEAAREAADALEALLDR